MDEVRILLVDDDPDFVDLHRDILEGAGYSVRAAGDVAEAWRLLEAERPDLILSDLMMEDLDAGFSLSRRIRQDPRFAGVPIVLVTAIASELGFRFTPESAEELSALGADAFFDKPVDPAALLRCVAGLLGRRGEPR